MSRWRDIDDGQPPESDGDASLRIDPFTGIVRTAMSDDLAHPADGVKKISRGRGVGDKSGQATHERASLAPDHYFRAKGFGLRRHQPPLSEIKHEISSPKRWLRHPTPKRFARNLLTPNICGSNSTN
jgi:hypothetical protein